MNYEEVKKRLLADPAVREAYDNPPLALVTARKVVQRRKELGMTQEQLAAAMGTSQAQVWRIESGHHNPTAKTLTRLEGALETSFGERFRDFPRAEQGSPGEQLAEWRESGVLVVSDADFERVLDLEGASPGQLRRLVRIIEDIEFDDSEQVRVTVRVEGNAEEGEPGSAAGTPRLELWATI